MRFSVLLALTLLLPLAIPGASATYDESDAWCPDIVITWGGVPSCKIHIEHTISADVGDCAIEPATGKYHSCFFRVECMAWGAGSSVLDPVVVEMRCGGAGLDAAQCAGTGGCSVEDEAFYRVWSTECWNIQTRGNVLTPWTTQYAETDPATLCVDEDTGPYVA